MDQNKLRKILESLAVGDAFGMPTEFMTRKSIKEKFGLVDTLLKPEESQNHSILEYGLVTDDTGQNFYLLEEYLNHQQVTIDNTVDALLKWVDETQAIEKQFIGPSSMLSLNTIKEGGDPTKTGLKGTTCGGIMRTPALVLASDLSKEMIKHNVHIGCLPTHNTSQALEAAMGYGYGLRAAILGASINEIIEETLEGCEVGYYLAPYQACSNRSKERIKYVINKMETFKNDDELLDFLYYIFGTGLESSDIAPAVMALFYWTKGDVFKAIQLSASIGGDTDTIACLVATLACAYSGDHNIPMNLVDLIKQVNQLNIEELATKTFERYHRV